MVSLIRILFILVPLSILTPVLAQETPTIKIAKPDGWREDVMKLPPDFAPQMSWTGWEIAEFSPGMFKADRPDFFSYVFVIEIEEQNPDWEDQLLQYFRGLSRAVMKNRNVDVSDFEVSMKGDSVAAYGTVVWIEPFATKKPQKLYLECRQIEEGVWIGCVSPKPWDWPIWTEMRRIRIKFEQAYSLTHRIND